MNAKTAFAALFGVAAVLLSACRSDDAGSEEGAAATTSAAESTAPTPEPSAAPTPVASSGDVPLVEQNLAYGEAGNANLIGYLVMPADLVGPLPGLIVIHGEQGLDDETRELTRRLAGERYIALAVNLYAGAAMGGARDAATRAGALVEQTEATLTNIRQAYDYLTKYASVPSVAAIGLASGGSWALRAGVALPDELDGVVTYDGEIITESGALSRLTAPVLGHFSGADESHAADARIFRTRLREEGKRAEIYIYPAAQMGFASRTSDTFNAASADEAWKRTTDFLGINLAREP